ncbi:MAG: oligosaccharyl transferase, archaeosortase A system-associated [Methanoregulaceae archaeon]|nr:oligosaccharyl transferase, archaeosortase A system-associated [Methanoregulaceae archaeon]
MAVLTAFVLWIRLLPLLQAGNVDILYLAGSDDPLYNLRQIEQMMRNFPGYGWYEAMTLFPTGQTVHWGPLFIIISSAFTMLMGAVNRPEIIKYALMVPPIMAALMVPLVFLLVRKISDWKCAIFASGLIAVIGGQYFFRSLYGYLDHHIAEVLFGTLFIFAYVYCMWWTKENPVDISKRETLVRPVILALLAGVAYILGLFTMPTMVLFALIIGVFTVIQFIWDFYRKQSSDYLLVTNVVVFGFATLAFFLVGIQTEGLQFNFYTIAHPLSYILLIIGTIFLYIVARLLKGKKAYYYPVSVIGIGIVIIAITALVSPLIYNSLLGALTEFFGQNPYYLTIQEARSWTFAEAWETFNYSLILMAGGLIIMFYRSWREERPDQHVILIWSVFMLIAAWQHIRYEYYLAVNIAVLGGICIGYVFNLGWKDLCSIVKSGKSDEPEKPVSTKEAPQKGKKAPQKGKISQNRHKSNYLNIGAIVLVVFLAFLFVISSFGSEYAVASSGALRMNSDWKESLEWMDRQTPQTGVDYYKIYNRDTFSYPAQAYGVMSWWDYGHMITYIAKRIPNANPFQSGVAGPNGAASYFMSQNESGANNILKNDGTRYIITDIEMDTGKFWAMATWYNATLGASPYQRPYLVPNPDNPSQYSAVTLYDVPYYQTMVSKLHNFDGSMTDPTTVYYVEYTEPGSSGRPYSVITRAENMDIAKAQANVDLYNSKAPAGQHAAILNDAVWRPLSSIPALQHYRLVHESPRNVLSSSPPDIKYVKVFEFVPGAKIKGEGIIEIPLVSNTGRSFVYRQASTNGEFIVPYSTTGNPYDVKATGKYHIIGTDKQFDVSEDAVMQGSQIN